MYYVADIAVDVCIGPQMCPTPIIGMWAVQPDECNLGSLPASPSGTVEFGCVEIGHRTPDVCKQAEV